METVDLPNYYFQIKNLITTLPLDIIFGHSVEFKPLTFQLVLAFFSVILLLFASSIMSGSEVAFFSLSPANHDFLHNNKSERNDKILLLLSNPQRLLATLLISNNFVNVAIVIISTYITHELIDFSDAKILAFVFQVIIVTFILLLFGEILPKVYAARFALKFALFIAPLIYTINYFLLPISSLLIRSTSIVNKKIKQRQQQLSLDDLSNALELTASSLSEDKEILKGIVKFGNIEAREIMKPRIDVAAVDIRKPFSRILTKIVESGYSRIPVYDTTFDHIKGILYIKDLLPHIEKDNRFRWQSLIRPPYFVPGTKKINDLLEEFQLKKIHMAIVVDEYGGTNGIVTMEDVLEEIVGEINDEYDTVDEATFVQIDENTYIFEAKTLLNDFYKILHLPSDIFDDLNGDADTLAGIILEIKGEIPQKNDIVNFKNFEFRIEAVDFRRIEKIMVKIQMDEIEDYDK